MKNKIVKYKDKSGSYLAIVVDVSEDILTIRNRFDIGKKLAVDGNKRMILRSDVIVMYKDLVEGVVKET